MNLYLLNLIGKWIGVLFITCASFFGNYNEKEFTVTNTNKNMSLDLKTEIIEYETEVRYNNEKPNGEVTVLVQGVKGYLIKNNENGNQKVMKEAVTEVKEVGTYIAPVTTNTTANALESYVGKLSVYYNCPTQTTCKTSTGYDLKKSIYYSDATYGNVRVLSAAQAKFKPGTIIEISGTPLGTVYGIVLDWGQSMVNAWNKGKVWIDLAVNPELEPVMKNYNSSNVTFNVKRWGW